MLSAIQIRQARALLGWTSETLSKRSKVGFEKVLRAQDDQGIRTVGEQDLDLIRQAFKAEGVNIAPRPAQ